MTGASAVQATRLNIREALERWARWRSGARYYGGGAVASGGQYLGGRGSRVCPTCKGSRRLPGHLVGSHLDFLNVPCPQCSGEGKVTGDLAPDQRRREIDCVFCAVEDPRTGTRRSTGELPDGRTCHKCNGGKRLIVHLKVHPATIKSTRYLGPEPDADPTSRRIEAIVTDWLARDATYWLSRVVEAEYCTNGTQEMKVRVMNGASQAWFAARLKEAHAKLAELLELAN